jgi:hypothetical protein
MKEGFEPDRKGELMWFTDGSKTNKGTGAGVYTAMEQGGN